MTPRPPTLYQVNRLPQSERSWDLFAGELYRRGETGTRSVAISGGRPLDQRVGVPVTIES
jgi:hypothetical protein